MSSPSTPDERELRCLEALRDRATQREKLIERLETEGEEALAAKLSKCGNPLELTCTCCGREKTVLTRCDLKWCPSCQHALATRTVERYSKIIEEMEWPLFVTFTVKNFDPTDTKFLFVRKVRSAFTRFRRLRWWKRAVKGGVASIEVTNRGNGWHPHIHALIDCRWLAVTVPSPRVGGQVSIKEAGKKACSEVAQQWEMCVDRKASVKVRRVFEDRAEGIKGAVRECLKYSVKGSDLCEVKTAIGPLIRQLASTRLVVSWGSLYRHSAVKRKKISLPCECGEFHSNIPTEFIPKAMCRVRL